MNILVVDCDHVQLQCLARGLKSKGHTVATAISKAESYSALENQGEQIHLLLSDLNVPRLNVFELIQKAREKNKILPAIIMTTCINYELKNKIKNDPYITLIEKPFVLEKLIREINLFSSSLMSG